MFNFNFCFWLINLCSCTYYKFCRNKKLLNHWIKRYKTIIKKKKKKHDKTVLSGEDKTTKKNKFFFSKCSEKMVFPIKLHWNIIQLVLSGKMILLFPENMILFFRWKKKRWSFSKKNTWKYDVFFKCSEKSLSKKIALEYDLFCNIWKDGISVFPKIYFFSVGGKWKMIFL